MNSRPAKAASSSARRVELAIPCGHRQRTRRGDDFGAAAIGQCYRQVQPDIVLGQPLRGVEVVADIEIKALTVADDAQPNPLLVQLGDFVAEVVPQQAGQVEDLGRGPGASFRC